MIYTGIGSRKTTDEFLDLIQEIGEKLARLNWTLRSGGADGADTAFETGCDKGGGAKEIYLPWKGFNKNKSQLFSPTDVAFDIAMEHHPAWHNCNDAAKRLHARNSHQILGLDCHSPSKMVIYWAATDHGGTLQAVRIARAHDIPLFNLAVYESPSDLCKEALNVFFNKVVKLRLFL